MYYIPKGHRAAAHIRSGKCSRQHKTIRPWHVGKKAPDKEPEPEEIIEKILDKPETPE